MALSPLAKRVIEPELLNGQLAWLADSVQHSLTRELRTINGLLAGLDKEVAQPRAQAAVQAQEEQLAWARTLLRASPRKEDFLPAYSLPPKFFCTLNRAGGRAAPGSRKTGFNGSTRTAKAFWRLTNPRCTSLPT